jgi:hypothetical protein
MSFGCVVCRLDIAQERARKGATTCSNECARAYRKAKRSELAEGRCRLCGRTKRKKLQDGHVRIEHTLSLIEAVDAAGEAGEGLSQVAVRPCQ